MLTPEEKRHRRIERVCQQLKALTIGSVFNKHPSGLACLAQRLSRLANADDDGKCQCISCDRWYAWNEMHGSHFIPRTNKATIIDPDNIWPACVNCNKYKDGNLAEYRPRLIAKIGIERVERLEKMQLPKNHVWNRWELAEIKVNLLDEIKRHEERLGVR